MNYFELILLLILSLLGLYIGSDVIVKAGKRILGQGFLIGIISAIPELFVILTLLFSRQYYLAISSVFTTALTIYSVGISLVSICAFIKWRKNKITLNNFQIQERPVILGIIGILVSIFVIREINTLIGIFSMGIFIYYFARKISTVKVSLKDLGIFGIGMLILWFSSEAFVFSSSNILPGWIFSIFFLPIVLNTQDIIVAIKGSLKNPELISQMTLSFLAENIVISLLVFGIMGILSIPAFRLILNYPLLALLISNIAVLLLFNQNNISIKESLILLSLYILVPLSATIHM